jgi:hypothetical protein
MLSLPHELLLEIPQYLGPIVNLADPSGRWDAAFSYEKYSIRTLTLTALSQTCRALRAFFLPLVWQYLNVCCAKDDNEGFGDWPHHMESISQNLQSKSNGLLRNPNLAAYVQCVHTFQIPV